MCDHHDKLRSDNKDLQKVEKMFDRREFLTKTSFGFGALALGSLLNADKVWSNVKNNVKPDLEMFSRNGLGLPHHVPKAKRVYVWGTSIHKNMVTDDTIIL